MLVVSGRRLHRGEARRLRRVEVVWNPVPPMCSGRRRVPRQLPRELAALLQGCAKMTLPACDKAAWVFLGLSMAGWNAFDIRPSGGPQRLGDRRSAAPTRLDAPDRETWMAERPIPSRPGQGAGAARCAARCSGSISRRELGAPSISIAANAQVFDAAPAHGAIGARLAGAGGA